MRIHRAALGQTFVPLGYPGYGPFVPSGPFNPQRILSPASGNPVPFTAPTGGTVIPGYSGPPITLINGRTITDPNAQPPNGNDCLPYQCGADSGNTLALQWCAQWGQAANLPCNSPSCAPVAQYLSCTPPAVGAPAPPQAQPQVPMLTPANIVQPLPDITGATAPLPQVTQTCSLWCDLNAAILNNPLIAAAMLAGAAFLLWPKGKR